MLQSSTGRQILSDRPLITTETVPIEALATYPEGTLGKAYANFMTERGFVSDERSDVKFVDDVDLAYVMTRYRQVHDFWHCLTATDTTVMAEISLKALEFLQTGIPELQRLLSSFRPADVCFELCRRPAATISSRKVICCDGNHSLGGENKHSI